MILVLFSTFNWLLCLNWHVVNTQRFIQKFDVVETFLGIYRYEMTEI